MPYVERIDGKIVGVYAMKQKGYAEELVKDDAPELRELLEKPIGQRCEEPVEEEQ